MFGLGSREAVVAALSGRDRQAFGAPADPGDLVGALTACGLSATASTSGIEVGADPDDPRLLALAFCHGWVVDEDRSSNSATLLVPLS
jgi:hypothetical protein